MAVRFGWRNALGLVLVAGTLGMMAVHIEGCTAVGFTVGALADNAQGKGPPERLLNVQEGTRITVWTLDGTKQDGKFMGISSPGDSLVVNPGEPLPASARIRLDVHGAEISVHADSVTLVSVPVIRGKVIGTLVGLAVDGIVVATAVSSAEESTRSGCQSSSPGTSY